MQGNRVGIVDTDVPSPGIHNIFGLEPEDIQQTLNSYLWGECEIEATAYDVSANIGLNNGKLFLVPSSVKADNIARILKDGYDVKLLNDGLRKFVKALALDYLFVDTHPGLSKETFLTIAICHILLLILRPDKQDYQGTAVAMDVAQQLKVRKMLLVLNKVLPELDFEVLHEKVESAYKVPVTGIFPLSSDIARLASEDVFCMKFPDHPVSDEYRKVAQRIMNEG